MITDANSLCGGLVDVLYLVGVVMFTLKIAVPIILIAVGSFDLVKAITSQKDDDIKKAGSSLAKKAVLAVAIFLIPAIVGLLISLVGGQEWEDCDGCIKSPFNTSACPQTLTTQ